MPLSTPPSAQAATALKSLRHKFFDREPCWHPLREGPAFRSLASAPASPTLKRSLTSFGLPARSLLLSSFCLPVSSFQSSPLFPFPCMQPHKCILLHAPSLYSPMCHP